MPHAAPTFTPSLGEKGKGMGKACEPELLLQGVMRKYKEGWELRSPLSALQTGNPHLMMTGTEICP